MTNLIIQKVQYINNTPVIPQREPAKPVQAPRQRQYISDKNLQDIKMVRASKRRKEVTQAIIFGGLSIAGIIWVRSAGSNYPKFAKHIVFIEAKTVEEARAFAKKHFNAFLDLGDNLDFSNYVNKMLVKINNIMRGKAQMPEIVKFSENMEDDFSGSWNNTTKTLTIGSSYRDFINMLKDEQVPIEKYFAEAIKQGGMAGIYVKEIEKVIPHEIGHATHFTYSPEAQYMQDLKTLEKLGLDKKLTNQFLDDIKYIKGLDGLYSDYHLSCPIEFVAETFAYKILGRCINSDIEKLYTKYKGPEVPKSLDLAA